MDADGMKLALDAHKQLIEEANSLWNVFTVVAFGVVGLIYGGVKFGSLSRARVPVTVGYIVWALANGFALVRNQDLLVTLTTSINASAAGASPVLRPFLLQLYAFPWWAVVVFHGLIDVVVLGAIWWPTLAGASAGSSRRAKSTV